MKKITKNEIQNVLRTGEVTDIWRTCYKVIGRRPTSMEVYNFVRSYAPTKKIYNMALYFAYVRKQRYDNAKRNTDFHFANCRHIAMSMLRQEISAEMTSYTKRPIIWGNSLFFASPIYRQEDYNKKYIMPVKGNERFCELLCSVADRFFEV